jgi:hypothetical protein
MEDRDILLVITICHLLGKQVNPAMVEAQYQQESRFRKFGHGFKWRFCSSAA